MIRSVVLRPTESQTAGHYPRIPWESRPRSTAIRNASPHRILFPDHGVVDQRLRPGLWAGAESEY